MLGHEVDGFGGNLLGGHGEVALVFAVFVVDDDDHAAGTDLGERGFDIAEQGSVGHGRQLKILAGQGAESLHHGKHGTHGEETGHKSEAHHPRGTETQRRTENKGE